MDTIKLFLKSFIVGLGKIIPGVSGSVMAIIFGIYERLLEDLSSLKKMRQDIRFLLIFATGLGLAILLGSKIIYHLFTNYYLFTLTFFIGMMLPGVLSLFKNVNNDDVSFKRIFLAILLFFSLIGLTLIDFDTTIPMGTQNHNMISLIFCGILDAASTIIPGISGSALLMIAGYYESVIGALSNIFNIESLVILIPFMIGMFIGIILISKLMTYMFKNHRATTYMMIISLAVFSIVTLLKNSLLLVTNFKIFFLSIIFLILGFLISYLLDKMFKS